MPSSAPRAPRTRRPRAVHDEVHDAAPSAVDMLSGFAAKLRVGQMCEGGCGSDATWAGIAAHRERFGCDAHIVTMLDHNQIWFLHPLGETA